MLREVGQREHAALLGDGLDDRLRDPALVEGRPAALADLAQRARQSRDPHDLAGPRGAAFEQQLARVASARELPLSSVLPPARGLRRHGEAALRHFGRGCEHLRQRPAAEAGDHVGPRGRSTRHRHGKGMERGKVKGAAARRAPGALEVQGRGRAARAVEGVDAAGRRLVVQAEGVAAEPRRARLRHGEGRSRGDRGVGRAAAPAQHLHAGGRGHRLARGDHAAAGEHGRAARDKELVRSEVHDRPPGSAPARTSLYAHPGEYAGPSGATPSLAQPGACTSLYAHPGEYAGPSGATPSLALTVAPRRVSSQG